MKIFGGQEVFPNVILARQRGFKWHPGKNTVAGKDHTIHSKIEVRILKIANYKFHICDRVWSGLKKIPGEGESYTTFMSIRLKFRIEREDPLHLLPITLSYILSLLLSILPPLSSTTKHLKRKKKYRAEF